jgi:hypothetical protein
MPIRHSILLIALLISVYWLQAQSGENEPGKTAESLQNIPGKYLENISSKADAVEEKLEAKSQKALERWQKQEKRIQDKLARLDPGKAQQLFGDAKAQYDRLQQKLGQPGSWHQYIPSIDTLGTSLKFLQQNQELLSHIKRRQRKA